MFYRLLYAYKLKNGGDPLFVDYKHDCMSPSLKIFSIFFTIPSSECIYLSFRALGFFRA